MRYQVPQFIDTELKLIGPFTLRQFLYLATGGSIIFMLNFALSGMYFIAVALPIGVLFAALAFVKIDGIPLPRYIAISISYLLNSRKYRYSNATAESQFQQFIPTEDQAQTPASGPKKQDTAAGQVLEKFGS